MTQGSPPEPPRSSATPYRTEDAIRRVEELQAELAALKQTLEQPQAPAPSLSPPPRVSAVFVSLGLLAMLATAFGVAAVGMRHRPRHMAPQEVFSPPPPKAALVPERATTVPLSSPTVANLRGVWSGPDGAFVVGDHGTALFRDLDGGVTSLPTNTKENLFAVAGSPVMAVGDHGTVLRFATDVKAWVPEPLPNHTADLRGADAIANAAVAVGLRGRGYLRAAEGSWVPMNLTDADLHGVALCVEEAEPHALVAVGASGTIVVAPLTVTDGRFRLGMPKRQKVPTEATLRSVHCDGSLVTVGGDSGVVLTTTLGADQPWLLGETPGAALTTLSTFRVSGEWNALALGRDQIWARGTDGSWRTTPFHPQDRAWRSMAVLSDDTLGTALLVVGDHGALARVDLSL
jgi:hypothetical protein